MSYSFKEHSELIEYSNLLLNQKKSIKDEPEKHDKLMSYSCQIFDFLHWKARFKYIRLLEDFIDNSINSKIFINFINKLIRIVIYYYQWKT